jgi:hypothetical protein
MICSIHFVSTTNISNQLSPNCNHTMDAVITFKEVMEFLKNPSLLAPHPDFNQLCALRQHIVRALKQLTCPQSPIHGWSSLAIAPGVYALLEPQAFVEPLNPGATAVYPPFLPPLAIKMIDAIFVWDKNYFLLLLNVNQACFKMLNDTIFNQFEVSNTPNLTGWNSRMMICAILEQLETSYGKLDMMTLFGNNTLFRSPFPANEAPEMLFYRIKQCNEIQILAQDPYTPTQKFNNAVCLLMQSGIFPLKEFDTWDAITPKTYPAFKMFIHEVYTRCLMVLQLCNTMGQQGYVPNNNPNMYNVLNEGYDTNSSTEGTGATQTAPITQTAAMTTGSTLGNTYVATILSEISKAINQLAANQTAIMTQMAAMALNPPPHHKPKQQQTTMFPPSNS